MRYTAVCLLLFIVSRVGTAHAQDVAPPPGQTPQVATAQDRDVSAGKAFALSLLLPGLGHQYVHGGSWDGWATVFALADAGLWTSLIGSEWRRNHLEGNYRTLAATSAGADIDGKGRDFYLNLASFQSSEEYLETQLRNRNWRDLDYTADPSFRWMWTSQDDFQRFRAMREDAESLRRRRSFIITTLVANRLIAGIAAIRGARRADDAAAFSLSVPPSGAAMPMMNLRLRW